MKYVLISFNVFKDFRRLSYIINNWKKKFLSSCLSFLINFEAFLIIWDEKYINET